jgi:hypothetical protein
MTSNVTVTLQYEDRCENMKRNNQEYKEALMVWHPDYGIQIKFNKTVQKACFASSRRKKT